MFFFCSSTIKLITFILLFDFIAKINFDCHCVLCVRMCICACLMCVFNITTLHVLLCVHVMWSKVKGL